MTVRPNEPRPSRSPEPPTRPSSLRATRPLHSARSGASAARPPGSRDRGERRPISAKAAKWNELFDAHPADRSADHQLLDLLRAFEDVVDLRVAVHALDRVFARVPVTAVDLDGALGDPHGDASGLELAL